MPQRIYIPNVTLLYTCVSTGYANEVGEAFRALVPVSLVWTSYAVATAYVTADAVDKGKKAAAVRCCYLYSESIKEMSHSHQ